MSDGGPWAQGAPRRRRSWLRLTGRILLYVLAGIGGLTTAVALVVVALAIGAADLPDRIVLSIDLDEGVPERRPQGPFARTTRVARCATWSTPWDAQRTIRTWSPSWRG